MKQLKNNIHILWLNHSTIYIILSFSLIFICMLTDFTSPLSIGLYIFIYIYVLLFSILIVLYTFFNVSAITITFFFLERSSFQIFFSKIILLSKKILYGLVGYPPSLGLTLVIVHFNIYNPLSYAIKLFPVFKNLNNAMVSIFVYNVFKNSFY